jgi:hypothetical protein
MGNRVKIPAADFALFYRIAVLFCIKIGPGRSVRNRHPGRRMRFLGKPLLIPQKVTGTMVS